MKVILSKKTGARVLIALLAVFLTLLLFSAAASAATLGDVNSDGVINILDVVLVNNYVLGNSTLTAAQRSLADVNRDNVVDIFDTVLIMQMASGMIYEFPSLPSPALTSPANNALVSSTLVTFQWNAVSGATMYQLEVMNSNTGVIFKNPVLYNSFTFTTESDFPNNGTPFRWRVRAGNSDGWGSWSVYRNFVSGTSPAGQPTSPPTVSLPAAPVLTVPAADATAGGSSISFQWNPSSGANKYELMVTSVSDGSPFRTQVLGDQTYTTQIGFPSDGSQFRWKVRAGNASGWGSWSTETTFTNSGTIGVPFLTSPVTGANVFGSAVTFRWNAASGATRYKLELYKDDATTPTWSQELGNVTSVSFNGLPNDGSEYEWRVLAGNISTWSGTWSAKQTFSNGLLPDAPVLTSPGSAATNPSEIAAGSSISFRWTAPTGVEIDKYNLEIVRVRDGLVLKNLILGNTTVSLQTGFPDDGTEYKWRVRAGSRDGWGPWPTAYFHFTNGGLNAPILTYPANKANLATSRITFEWKPVSGATKYRLVIKDSTGGIFNEVTLGSAYASLQRDFPNDGTEYTWEVYAGNRDGNWSPAATRTFTNGSSLAVPLQLAPVINAAVSPADATYSVDFSWSTVSDATKYQLEVINVRNGSVFADEEIGIVAPATAPATMKNLPDFADSEQYKWRVRAGDASIWGTWSPYRDFIYYYETPVLTAPSLLSPASYATAASETVQFRWTAVNSATDGYHLQVRRVGNGELFFEDDSISPAGETYSAEVFPNDSTQFMWRVRANDNGAWSLYQYFTNGFWWRW
jgi:hypothetical protein